MGRGLRAHRRGHPRRASGQGGRHGAERLGDRLGRGRDPLRGLFTYLPAETAWRALFLTGVLPALLVFYIRCFVEEPPVYREAKRRQAETGERVNVLEIFNPAILKRRA